MGHTAGNNQQNQTEGRGNAESTDTGGDAIVTGAESEQ